MPLTYPVRWLSEAVADLVRIREFIHDHHPDAARRAAERIREAIQKLTTHPMRGRPVLDITHPTLRDLFILFGGAGYGLRYTVTDDSIIIVRIWHVRENKVLKGEYD